jgi:hypothetical protein
MKISTFPSPSRSAMVGAADDFEAPVPVEITRCEASHLGERRKAKPYHPANPRRNHRRNHRRSLPWLSQPLRGCQMEAAVAAACGYETGATRGNIARSTRGHRGGGTGCRKDVVTDPSCRCAAAAGDPTCIRRTTRIAAARLAGVTRLACAGKEKAYGKTASNESFNGSIEH